MRGCSLKGVPCCSETILFFLFRGHDRAMFVFVIFIDSFLLCSLLFCSSQNNGLLHGALVQIVCADVQTSYFVGGLVDVSFCLFASIFTFIHTHTHTPAYPYTLYIFFTRFNGFWSFAFIFGFHLIMHPSGGQFLLISGSIEVACRRGGRWITFSQGKKKLWHAAIGGWEDGDGWKPQARLRHTTYQRHS